LLDEHDEGRRRAKNLGIVVLLIERRGSVPLRRRLMQGGAWAGDCGASI